MPEIKTIDSAATREDLVRACEAAKTPGHLMRHVVLAHFADRILELAADHRTLQAEIAKLRKRSAPS